MKSKEVDESLSSTTTNVLFQRRIYLLFDNTREWEIYKKIILEQHGMEVLQLFKGWERFQIRDCNYRNHRIFTLKCIMNDLVPVNIRLKTTVKTEKATKIIRKAERDLLQTRVKSINSILGDNAKQRELCWSQLVSILSKATMDKCQQWIDKISETRPLKVRER